MPRETKEQKQLRWAAEEHAALVAKQNFKMTMPAKLAELRKLAPDAGVNVRIDLTETGPIVEFTRWNHDNRGNDFEETITYDTEQWEVESIERRLHEFREEINSRIRRRGVAEDTWARLTAEEKAAVKEFIIHLM